MRLFGLKIRYQLDFDEARRGRASRLRVGKLDVDKECIVGETSMRTFLQEVLGRMRRVEGGSVVVLLELGQDAREADEARGRLRAQGVRTGGSRWFR